MRYLFQCAFKGTRYHGWQRQPEVPSIQESIELAIQKVLQISTSIHGCGRTDAGVHASQYFFHTNLSQIDTAELLFILNKNLPSDIRILDIMAVPDTFNAQLHAVSRTYRYYCHFHPDPFLNDLSFYLAYEPDVDIMQKAIKEFEGEHDFRSFCIAPERQEKTTCYMSEAQFSCSPDGKKACFEFTADRFIRGMVRLLVGNILELGAGRSSLDELSLMLHEKKEPSHFNLAFPQGLYLAGVSYREINLPVKGFMPHW